jgi:pimeloyl-ACP methyl ester carboxylesterase
MFAAQRVGSLGGMAALVVACANTQAPAPAFDVKACPAAWTAFAIVCGEVRAPEDYAAPDRRSVALNVVVLRAAGDNDEHEAQFELDGGPGLAVVDTVAFYATDGAMYRRTRDVVFVDMRGTGGSNPLRCPEIEQYNESDAWGAMYPGDFVARCAAQLSAGADLKYTTSNAVRDLETVRAALGYERIVFNALSYGTTLALAYIAEHPERVRAAVLTGPVPVDRTPPRHHATAATRALQKLFAACAAQASCRAAFPDPAAALQRAHANAASISDERADIFMERLRSQLYSAAGARRAMLTIQRAANNDFSAIDALPEGPGRIFADGLYLSITCAESFPHFPIDEASASAGATAFGDYRLRRQIAACAAWPVAPNIPPSPTQPLQTPVLFVSGEYDPVTPPEWVDYLLPLFPNGRHIILPGAGHIVDGMSDLDTCYDPTIVAFLDSADAANLDAACIKGMRAPDFLTE